MKLFKKTLCVFLSALMLFTGLSVGLVGYAASTALDDSYKSLAYSFVNFTKNSSNVNVVTKDEKGIPSLTILGDMDNYTTSTDSGNYEYANTDGSPIRSVSYTHKVTAKDDGKYTIRNAENIILGIADSLISYEYGEGLYTVPMIIEEITENLKYFKADDGEYLFLDGYTYYINSVGDIVARSPEKTYTVSDSGKIEYNSSATDDETEKDEYAQLVESGIYTPMTLFDVCHVDTIVQYLLGNCSSLNSGNWFHDFEFYVYTDVDTVLVSEGANLSNSPLKLYETSVVWTFGRQYDDSGLKAQYYNLGYVKNESSTTSTIRTELKQLNAKLSTYFNTYYAEGKLDHTTNDQLIDPYYNYYDDITEKYSLFDSISDEAKIAIFGQRAYSYVNLVTQLTPVKDKSTGVADKYNPVHTYEKYTDRYGNNIEFNVTTENVTSLVSSIDALLQNKAITHVLGMFLDLSEYGVDLNADANMTPHDAIIKIIENLVFSDDIVNMLIELIYPMLCNLLDDLITDEFIEDTLKGIVNGIDLSAIVDAVADNATSWNALIYGTLAVEGNITLTPAGMAWIWNKYGYASDPNYSFCDMQAMHDMLKAAKGGINNDDADHETGEYYLIGCQYNEYYKDHWRDVDWSQMVWNINGDKERFLLALDAALAPLAPLLAVVMCGAETDWYVTSALLVDLDLVLEGIWVYNDVFVPLFETLGITAESANLMKPKDLETIAQDMYKNPNSQKVASFLNGGLLNPLLTWITDILLENPIDTVVTLLPNLSYFMTSGYLLDCIQCVNIPITLKIKPASIPISFKVHTVDLYDLLKDDIAFLDSLQGIIDLIDFSVNTGKGVVGYYSETAGNYAVYTPDSVGYDETVHKTPTSVAYMNKYGEMNLYESDEYTEKIVAKDDDGNYTQYALRKDIAYCYIKGNKIVDKAGANEDEYTPLKEYYKYVVKDEYYDSDLDKVVTTSTTYKVRTLDEVPEQYKKSAELVQSYYTIKEKISLPAIMDYKLQACGTLVTDSSLRNENITLTDYEGVETTWTKYYRKYIKMEITDKNGTYESYGLVFIFLLRYVLSALGYSEYEYGDFVSEYTLLDAFGLDDESLADELIDGLGITLGDIIYHVCLNPDGIIAALFELLIGGEEGSLYIVNELGKVVSNPTDYSYAPETVNYYADEIIQAAEEHNDFQYGTAVLYNEYWTRSDAEYIVDNLDGVVEDVFAMLKLDDMESLNGFLSDMLNEYVLNNDMVTMIVSMVYSMLGSLDFDLGTILKELLDVDYSKRALLDSISYMFDGIQTEMYTQIQSQVSKGDLDYTDYTFSKATVDKDTGEVIVGESYDWGFNNPEVTAKYSDTEIFLRALSAAFGPFSIVFEWIFLGEDINLLDIVHIPMYEIYHYAWIPLMEALGATSRLSNFKDYYTSVFANPDGDIAGGTAAVYYLLEPIIGLVEDLLDAPVETLMSMIPNLIFVLSIGGLNGIVNNIAHFAYVLLDILEPVVDVYPVLNSFLSNLEIGDMTLNLSLPLDVDLNQIVNDLLDGLLGSALSFEIENDNIVLGTKEVEKEVDVPVVDENGEQLYDPITGLPLTNKEMQTVTEEIYAVGELSITLPFLDLTTLCSGEIQEKNSQGGYRYIYLNSAGGADFITLLLRLVTDTLFYEDNWVNITNFLIGFCDLDDEDNNDAVLMEIMMYLHTKAEDARMNDVLMKLILTIFQVLIPIADELGDRFSKVDFSVTDMFDDMDNIGYYAEALMNASGEKNETLSGFARLIQLIKEFFAKIEQFFANMFG